MLLLIWSRSYTSSIFLHFEKYAYGNKVHPGKRGLVNANKRERLLACFSRKPENFLAPKSTPKSHLYKHESLILQGCPFMMKILTYNKVSCLETSLFTSNSVNCRAQNRPEKFRSFRAFEKAGTPVLYSLGDRRYTGREGEGECFRKNETQAWNTDFILLGMDRCLKG